jgi:hypothetical protein
VLRIVGVALTLAAAAAVAAANGRVVRIVRSGAGPSTAPRLCEIRGDSGNCVGEEPKPGQMVTVLDERHVIAEVQIVEANSLLSGCRNLWSVKTRVVRGGGADSDGIGVIDPGINPSRARMLDKTRLPASPSGQPGEEVWRAIDRDGDGTADILITRYSCDAASRPVAGSTYCIDVWERSRAPGGQDGQGARSTKMSRATRLNFAQCNI